MKGIDKNFTRWYSVRYKYGEGFAVGTLNTAPATAGTGADVIVVYTVKRRKTGPRKGKLHGTANYYTPDEAMSIALGLMRSVDHTLEHHYSKFRAEKDEGWHKQTDQTRRSISRKRSKRKGPSR